MVPRTTMYVSSYCIRLLRGQDAVNEARRAYNYKLGTTIYVSSYYVRYYYICVLIRSETRIRTTIYVSSYYVRYYYICVLIRSATRMQLQVRYYYMCVLMLCIHLLYRYQSTKVVRALIEP
jgi:hypothetical protein